MLIFCAISACDTLQGYAFARPMARADLETFIRSGSWRPPETTAEAVHRMVRKNRGRHKTKPSENSDGSKIEPIRRYQPVLGSA